ncbi:MAG: hypothetical protein Kow0022_08760 [Phycisphaerales bacterium]
MSKDATRTPALQKHLARLPFSWQAVLLADALPEAGRAEIDSLIRAALPVLDACSRPRGRWHRMAETLRTWPHRVNRADLGIRILAGVLLHWKTLDEPLKTRILSRPGAELAQALQRTAEIDPQAAGRFIASHPQAAFGDVALALMGGSDRAAARAAADAFLRLVVSVFQIETSPIYGDIVAPFAAAPAATDAERQMVLRGLRAALEDFGEHRMKQVLLAALLLADGPASPGTDALQLRALIRGDHPVRGGLRTTIRLHPAPFVRERAWRWMREASLQSAAVDRLRRAGSVLEHELVLAQGHLILHPARQAALRGVGAEVVPKPACVAELSAAARRWLPEVVESLRADPETRSALRASGLTDPAVSVRLAYVRTADVVEQTDLTFDADPRVARSASLARSPAGARSWVRWPNRPVDQQRARLAGLLTRSPHPQVRAIARQDAARFDPWGVDRPESRLAAREWLAADRASFMSAVRRRMIDGDEHQRTAAIRLARMLGITGALEQDLLELAAEEEACPRVAATAVSALGDAGGVTAREGIVRALSAGDDRVRANAVEAAVRCSARLAKADSRDIRLAEAVVELKADPHHRVRANAWRGLIERGCAQAAPGVIDLEGIRQMLTDEREMHRLAGLWLTERTVGCALPSRLGRDWEWVCRRVAGLASRDEDDAVRARAARCGRRLLGLIGSRTIEVRAAA